MGVSVEETVWIELSDGCRLAGRLWRPAERDEGAAAAVLEYLPYRRRDRHRFDDAILHPAFAAAGYAALRVDMRGAGDSDGIMTDEYTPGEWADAVEVIDWLASQPWCNGSVGMIGLSWSGFNALQVASFAPPALKAIVTTCASDDRYADDMHYMGGCLLSDNLQYGATLFTWLATPPDPEVVGARWRGMWMERLEAVSPPALRWMRHPDRDAYWRRGSVCEDYTLIKAPVLAVGGWADGYTNAVMRLLANLPGPRKGLIGPWGHAFPHVAKPGPAIDFIAYVTRWWDHWLNGNDTGLMDEPMLTCWMQESEAPRPAYGKRRGRWVAERSWPSANIAMQTFRLSDTGLTRAREARLSAARIVASPPDLGTASGEWCPYGWGPDMPLDQRADDSGSAVFDSEPLKAPLQILGGAICRLELDADAAEGVVAVRLNDVSSDGVSRRITYGLLNLAHRLGHGEATEMRSGQTLDLTVRMNDIAYEVPAGHRLRLAVSSAYWPLAVGVPRVVTLCIGGGTLELPVRLGEAEPAPDLGNPVVPAYPEGQPVIAPERGRLSIHRDLKDETTTVEVVRNLGVVRLEDVNLELRALGSETYTMPWNDPASAWSETRRLAGFAHDAWKVEVRTATSLRFSAEGYRFDAEIKAFESDEQVFERAWSEIVPRGSAPPSCAVKPQLCEGVEGR
jgi:uncharacterized protein